MGPGRGRRRGGDARTAAGDARAGRRAVAAARSADRSANRTQCQSIRRTGRNVTLQRMPPKLTLYAWLLLPVALIAYHFGPGQAHLLRDEAARQLAAAVQAEKQENWKG